MNAKALLSIAAIAAVSLLATDLVEAKRLGGGRSVGVQRQSIAPPASTPPATAPAGAASQPVMPAQPGVTAAKPAAAPAASGPSRWLGPIAGIAAGLGLAALLSHFGLSEGFASVLLLALLAIGVVFLLRLLMARREPSRPTIQYAGAGGGVAHRDVEPTLSWGGAPKMDAPPAAPVVAAPSYAKPLPPGFDATGFVREAKQQFIRIQAAWDAGDRDALADVMTPEMLAEVVRDLAGRADHRGTEIATLDAEVLEVTTEEGRHWVSVHFTGSLREDGAALPKPFDEAWNLTKPVDGSSGWLLAGIQQLA